MSIRLEIAAETIDELITHLSNLHKLGLIVVPGATVLVREDETEAAVTAEFDIKLPEASPQELPPPKVATRKKSAASPAKTAKGNASAVKPLPVEDDDPLAIEDEGDDSGGTDPPFDKPAEEVDPAKLTPEALIGAATDKLRDLFKSGSSGVVGVRKLREKYHVTYFHEVDPAKAKALWTDAVKLEGELAA